MKYLAGILLAAFIIGSIGCTTIVKPVPAFIQNGAQVYGVSCHGNGSGMGVCYQAASNLCGGNFDVVDSSSGRGPGVMMAGGMIASRALRELYFTCNKTEQKKGVVYEGL